MQRLFCDEADAIQFASLEVFERHLYRPSAGDFSTSLTLAQPTARTLFQGPHRRFLGHKRMTLRRDNDKARDVSPCEPSPPRMTKHNRPSALPRRHRHSPIRKPPGWSELRTHHPGCLNSNRDIRYLMYPCAHIQRGRGGGNTGGFQSKSKNKAHSIPVGSRVCAPHGLRSAERPRMGSYAMEPPDRTKKTKMRGCSGNEARLLADPRWC